MGMPDITYECHEAETSYRVIPNPDSTPGVGFKHGATLQWKDSGEDWRDNWFIAPEAMEAIGQALIMAAKDHNQ